MNSIDSEAALAKARAAFAAGDAQRAYDLASAELARDRNNVVALSILANAAMQLQRLADADSALTQLQALRPDDAAIPRSRSRVLNRMGHCAAEQQDLVAAILYWRKARQLWSHNDDAAFNLVLHGAATVDDDEAWTIVRELHARAPNDAGVCRLMAELDRNRGAMNAAALRLSELDDTSLRGGDWRALALTLGDELLIERCLAESLSCPQVVDIAQPAYSTLSTLQDMPATQALGRVLDQRFAAGKQSPSLRLALAQALSLPAIHRDQNSIHAARADFAQGIARLSDEYGPSRLRNCAPRLAQLNWSNFLLAYHCEDDLSLQSRYGDWLSMAAATLRPELAQPRSKRRAGPPRIGLLSGHWHLSTAGSYFASWIEALDLPEFDTRVFALGPRFDAFTDRLQAGCRNFLRLGDDIDVAAEIIGDADLDLLIYPELGMDTRLLPLAALPLARRQWVAWGHPVTTGLPTIDGFLSCADMEPSNASSHYRESLYRLPGLGTRYWMPDIPQRRDRADLGLPEGELVVVPQSLFKIHPDNDAVLDELLALRPKARILMFASHSRLEMRVLRQRLLVRLGARHFTRLLFSPLVSRARFLEILASANLMLDTVHWSGGNTALDALRSGLPIATTRSRFMRGRQSAAMLQALGEETGIATASTQLATLAALMLSEGSAVPSAERLHAYLDSNEPIVALQALARQAVAGVV